LNLCIDSSIAVDVMRGRKPHYRDRLLEARTEGDIVHLSTIVLHELIFGARLSARPEHQMRLVEHFRSGMVAHDWTEEDAIEAATIRADLTKRGLRIELPDILIAGQARRRGWALVTANTRDFSRISGLTLVDWDAQ
jgi:tRNA(fMet)-specific endonuclease VapC